MAKETKYGLREFKAEFPDDDACLAFLFAARHTPECSCGGRYARLSGRKQFQCSKCRFQIAPMTGTIFEKSSSPLTLWFHAMFIFSNAKSGISAKEMERQLNVTYKTAWRMLHLIRKSLKQSEKQLKGVVEADESYHGGKGDGGVYNENQSKVMAKKMKVVMAIQRDGDTKAQVIPRASRSILQQFIRRNVQEGASLFTDGSRQYPEQGFDRGFVEHGRKQWTKERPNGQVVHINTVEAFTAHVKRSIKGTHKVVSKQYFQEYLNAFVWLRNNRHNDRVRFHVLASLLAS
jgi:transposase